jgi:S1-C subfamily serine protease|tara:strand:- start:13 stop:1692 length:1680 start_codon:yes stop_codon:yes gene_type:complete
MVNNAYLMNIFQKYIIFSFCIFFINFSYSNSCPGKVIDLNINSTYLFTGMCSENDIRKIGETTYNPSKDYFRGHYSPEDGTRSYGTYSWSDSEAYFNGEFKDKIYLNNGKEYNSIGRYYFENGNQDFGHQLDMITSGFASSSFEENTDSINRKYEIGVFKGREDRTSALHGFGARFFYDNTSWTGLWENGKALGEMYYEYKEDEYYKYIKKANSDLDGPYEMNSSDFSRLKIIQDFLIAEMEALYAWDETFDKYFNEYNEFADTFYSDSSKETETFATNNSDLIESIQQLLLELGYSPGPIDGLIGSRTIAAIKAFEYELELDEISGEPSEELLVALQLAIKYSRNNSNNNLKNDPILLSTGSGFYVSSKNIVTNNHVVSECKYLKDINDNELNVIAADTINDLAVLEGPSVENFLTMAFKTPKLGEKIYVGGFPYNSLIEGFNFTAGNVSSLVGIGQNSAIFKITAPIQPGNSGGPILNENMGVVGVVIATLDNKYVFEKTGSLPQNINFGVKNSVLKTFLNENNIKVETKTPFYLRKSQEVIAREAKKSSMLIKCYE